MKKAAMIAAAVAFGLAAPALGQSGGPPEVKLSDEDRLSWSVLNAARGEDSARDPYRHPAQTLRFFDVRPGMTVVDYMPSGGWYSRILIPYLGQDGTYIGMNPAIADGATGYMARMAGYGEKLPGQVDGWLGRGSWPQVIGMNVGDEMPAAMAGSVDRVLIFREMHNMHRNGWMHSSLKAMHAMLKDDGMVGIVQHRAPHSAAATYTDGSKGYMREADVIAIMQVHGFDLGARSEINANPNDPADWPNGVWTLPPSYGGATDDTRARLAEIGESDRMTLLFRKRM